MQLCPADHRGSVLSNFKVVNGPWWFHAPPDILPSQEMWGICVASEGRYPLWQTVSDRLTAGAITDDIREDRGSGTISLMSLFNSFFAQQQLFFVANLESVLSHLEKWPALFLILLDAYEVIQRHFPDAELTLKVVEDRETPEHKQLVLLIASRFSVGETIKRLRRLDADWFERDFSRGKLLLHVEFK
jgi:hypothetical protein